MSSFRPTLDVHVPFKRRGEQYLRHIERVMPPKDGYDGEADAKLALLRDGLDERRGAEGGGTYRCVCCNTQPMAAKSCYCSACKSMLSAEVRLLRTKHGPPPDDGVCCICERVSSRSLCLDHDHSTGVARGYVCHRCNAGVSLVDNHRSEFDAHMARFG